MENKPLSKEQRDERQAKMQSLWNEFTREPKPQQITTGHEGDE